MIDRLQKSLIDITINVKGIIDFHKISGQNRVNTDWGSFENPFRADQFSNIDTKGDIPVIYPGIDFLIKTTFIDENFIDIKSLEFRLAGGIDFTITSPMEIWADIFELSKMHGAIDNFGNFLLSKEPNVTEKHGIHTFLISPSENVTNRTQNLIYGLFFAINVNNQIKYCRIDPMLRTSSEDT